MEAVKVWRKGVDERLYGEVQVARLLLVTAVVGAGMDLDDILLGRCPLAA